MLLSVDYTSEDNKQIIDLLLQCFHRPIYIKNDDVSRVIFSHCEFQSQSLWFFLYLIVVVLSLSCQPDDVCIVTGKAIPGVSF